MTTRRRLARAIPLAALCLATPAQARDALGMFGGWGAFRDAAVPRCYAIALPEPAKGAAKTTTSTAPTATAYADVGTWPKRGMRNQVHFRLGHRLSPTGEIILSLGGQHFKLVGTSDVWASDPRMDAAVVAAMRSASSMSVTAHDASGKPFTLTWPLAGAASAMDSAALGCAELR